MKSTEPLANPAKDLSGKRAKWRKLFFKRISRKCSHLSEASETTARHEPETPPLDLPEHPHPPSGLFDFSSLEE